MIASPFCAFLLACGQCEPPNEGDDAHRDAQFHDAAPLPYPNLVWESTIPMSDPRLFGAQQLSKGVAIVAEPQLVLWGFDDEELGRDEWPAPTAEGGAWYVHWDAYIRRSSGEPVVVFYDAVGNSSVQQYAPEDLEQVASTLVPDTWQRGIAEADGSLYMLSGPVFLDLHELQGGAVVATTRLSGEGSFLPSSRGVATPENGLLFCVIDGGIPVGTVKVALIDTVTHSMTTLDVSEPGGLGSGACRLVSGESGHLLYWADVDCDCYKTAVVSTDGRSVLAGPTKLAKLYGTVHGGAYANGQFALLVYDGSTVATLHLLDRASGQETETYGVRLGPGERLWEDSLALASDGTHFFIAVAPALPAGPRQLRLQKLAPLATQQARQR